jgi:hypothetical protein
MTLRFHSCVCKEWERLRVREERQKA